MTENTNPRVWTLERHWAGGTFAPGTRINEKAEVEVEPLDLPVHQPVRVIELAPVLDVLERTVRIISDAGHPPLPPGDCELCSLHDELSALLAFHGRRLW